MMPCMNSYPHQMSQMPFSQHNHPGLDTTQMKIDPRIIPASYDICPYGGNYGYPLPCHGCCNHSYFPGYYTCRPPYPPHPHFPQAFPFNYHGAYPQVPEPYHAQYGPRQLYSMEQPRYEYDKNTAGNHHCCGCSNHTCNNDNTNFKIEEQKPEFNGRSSESLGSNELKNYPYPVVWLPPGCLKNKEQEKPFESNAKNWDEVPLEKKSQNQVDDDRNRFPLPIIWMPSDDKLEKAERNSKESNDSQESVEGCPSHSRVVPWKSPSSDVNEKILRAIEENSRKDMIKPKISEKGANRKSIPVKQMEPHGEMRKISESNETKGREIAVMHADNSGTGKSSESCTKRQSSSPLKTSKLPPICLRVDPLPRRKNGNGSPRSTSPGHKGKSHEALDTMVNASALTDMKEDYQHCPQFPDLTADKSKEAEPNKKEMRIIEVTEMPAREKVDENLKREENTVDLVLKKGTNDDKAKKAEGSNKETDKAQSCHGECKIDNDKVINYSREDKSEEVFKSEKRNLPDEEAAIIIQSAYRGNKVRKWEPLKKLKQIYKIREQVDDVTKSVQALQSSSDHQRDEKRRMIIGETIMSLLLKLDTIQGLPPSLREVRKSVARELTRLQEMLDSSTVYPSEGCIEEASIELQDECTDTNNDGRGEIQSGDNEFSENNNQCSSPHVSDVISGPQGEVTSEFSHDGAMDAMVEAQVSSELEAKMREPELITECKDEEGNSQGLMPEIQEGNYESTYSKGCLGDGAVGEVQSQMAENDNSTLKNMDLEMNLLAELPQEEVSEVVFAPQSEQLQNMERAEDEVLKGGQVERMLAAHVQQDGDDNESNMEKGVALAENGGVQPDPCETLQEGPLALNAVKLNVPDEKEGLGDANVKVELVQAQAVISNDNQLISGSEKAEPLISNVEESHGEDLSGVEVSDFENSVMDLEQKMVVEQLPGENFCPNHEPAGASDAKSCQLAFFAEGEGSFSNKQEGEELHDADHTSPEPIYTVTFQENEIPVGEEVVTSIQVPVEEPEDHLDKPAATGGEEGEAMQEEKLQFEELESEPGNVECLAELNEVETVKDRVLVSSTISHTSNGKLTESDNKLIEENEMLKELISNLSERVKVLEKKLSRKKKSTRTSHYRAPKVYGSACIKCPNDSVNKRVVAV